MSDIIRALNEVLEQRKQGDPEASYVAALYRDGTERILKKVGEEAAEVIMAGKDADHDPSRRPELVKEIADLWFHCLVLLNHLDLQGNDVLDELARRFGVGGHEEKASRKG